ncbi:MAG: efflux RND transporter periplasmic adaptor subunit [Gallionella sp.]|nr:efflux RND transporter periplasmic adaptor subunit [Gallionella sp.]
MKQANVIVAGVLVVVAAAGGYWLGGQKAVSAGQKTEAAQQKEPARKILYYRNAMGLPDTSPVPKKDSMGMDYVPVYEGGDEPGNAPSAAPGQVTISVEKVQKLGVKTEQAALRMLDKTVRAAGRVEANERHIYSISPKFEGWIEKLHINTTGEPVKKGQALFDAYSPELVSAQREYEIAAEGIASLKGADGDTRRSMQQLAESSLLRLKNWDISEQQLQDLSKSETTRRSLTFHSPVNGIVLEKKALQGMRFMPGEMLYQIADLSSVWVVADVFEQDIALVRTGAKAKVRINAYPDKQFDAVVAYVYPTLNPATRTVSVRLEISNPQGLLKPAMFAQVEMPASGNNKVLAVPTSAVIDSGTRQIVLVQLAEGRFEPREVRLGSRSDNYVEVVNGVTEGEQVVVAANFLIDAESNLKAALGGLGGHAAHGGSVPAEVGGKKPDTSKQPAKVVGHQAQGTLDALDSKAERVTITHGPITSLGWPGMTMDFALANSSLAQGIKPGIAISFELVERKPGEYVITKLQAKQPAPHEGH